jgi:hypothetical protein
VPETCATQTDQLWAIARDKSYRHAMPPSVHTPNLPTTCSPEAYKEVLTALGVDLQQAVGAPGKPDDIYPVAGLTLDATLAYPELRTDE